MSQCRAWVNVWIGDGSEDTAHCTDTEGHAEAHSCKIWWSSGPVSAQTAANKGEGDG